MSSSTRDDPQNTPHPERDTLDRMLAQIGTRVHLIRQDLAKLEDLPAIIAELRATVESLRTATVDLTNQVVALTKAVSDIALQSQELDWNVSALRARERDTEKRLRLVEGAPEEGGLDP